MWKKILSRRLEKEVEVALAPLSGNGDLFQIVREPLSATRRALARGGDDRQPWPLLPAIVCEAAGGRCEPALPAAAALQLMMAAGDVFDDLEDMDSPESLSVKYGPAVAINAATVLLVLAEKGMCRLKETGLDDHLAMRVLDVFNSYYVTACIGQHADISLAGKLAITEDDYLRIISQKSASQVECACHIGALLAGADANLVQIFSAFGHSLGMASQIANDIQGIAHGSDIQRGKITLPLVFALNNLDKKARQHLEFAFSRREGVPSGPEDIPGLIFSCGGVHYATVKMEFFKQEAMDFLFNAQKAGAGLERLLPFLE